MKIERDTANANFSLLIEFMVAQVKLKYYVTHSTVFIVVCRLTVWGVNSFCKGRQKYMT